MESSGKDVSVLTMHGIIFLDGQVHHFDLCEECYDELVSGFKIPVDREEQIEFL